MDVQDCVKRGVRRFGAVVAFALYAVVAGGAVRGGEKTERRVHGALTLPPVKTFAEACARCHGPEGSFYGEGFGGLEGEALHEIVEEMMVGPGALDPTQADVEAMVAYHRALAAGEPFVAVLNPEEAVTGGVARVRTDVSPGAEITLRGEDGRLEVRVVRGGRTTRLTLPAPHPWSHAE